MEHAQGGLGETSSKLLKIDDYFEKKGERQGLQTLLERVLLRIAQETGANDELQGIVKLEWIANWGKVFGAENGIIDDESLPQESPARCYKDGTVHFNRSQNLEHPAVLLAGLAKQGLPKNFTVLFHELIHRLQYQAQPTDYRKFMKVMGTLGVLVGICLESCKEKIGLDNSNHAGLYTMLIACAVALYPFLRPDRSTFNSTILHETQAYGAQMTIGTEVKGVDDIAERIQRDYHGRADFVRGQFEAIGLNEEWFKATVGKIFDQIQKLRALGTTHQEIAELIVQSEQDKLQNGAETLEQAIASRKEQMGVDDAQLAQRVANLDILREKLIESIKRITKEEIDKIYSSEEIQTFLGANGQGFERQGVGTTESTPAPKNRHERRAEEAKRRNKK